MIHTVYEICSYLDKEKQKYNYIGDKEFLVKGFCSLNNLQDGCITWLKKPEKIHELEGKEKNILIVTLASESSFLKNGNYIICDDPKKTFFSILNQFYKVKSDTGIAKNSIIKTKDIGKNVVIGFGCYIDEKVELEDGVIIGNNVLIECPTHIGKNSIVHSGVVIGTDGFGYYENGKQFEKVPHFGGVRIGENVEIGANTCIDRGTLDDTYIGDGTKIDNLCHIAHNVQIGKNCLVIACSLLGGSCHLKDNVYIAPGAIVKNQIDISDNSLVGMGAVVIKDIDANQVVAGVPARVIRNNEQKI